jgi:anaerobic carbon-monoxide dehydrogenase catalytic subunit
LLPDLPAGPLPHYQEIFKGICGAHGYTIVARNLIRAIAGGCGAHADHSRHMFYAIHDLLEGKAPDYSIEDPQNCTGSPRGLA